MIGYGNWMVNHRELRAIIRHAMGYGDRDRSV